VSPRARRILAMTVCTIGGAWAMLESVAHLQRQGHPLVTLALFLLALFLLLSAVGLARPWIPTTQRPRAPDRRRAR
jgi:hypothetical protein